MSRLAEARAAPAQTGLPKRRAATAAVRVLAKARGQGVPQDVRFDPMIREVRVVKLDAIPSEVPRFDFAGRRAQIAERARCCDGALDRRRPVRQK